MMCAKPYRMGVEAFPCGRCMPCRINRSSIWSTRMILESYAHGDSVFVTLTYNDESLPADQGRQSQRADVRAFLQRLRRALPQRIRYFICPEFGPKTNRLHYHGILFGVSTFDAAAVDFAWQKGFTQVGDCNTKTIAYCAKYVLKGDSRSEQEHEKPTRAFMSRNPGIGHEFARLAGSKLGSVKSLGAATNGLVRIDGKTRPVGRYLSRKLSEFAGCSDDERQKERENRAFELVDKIHRDGTGRYYEVDVAQRGQHGLNARSRIEIQTSKEKL